MKQKNVITLIFLLLAAFSCDRQKKPVEEKIPELQKIAVDSVPQWRSTIDSIISSSKELSDSLKSKRYCSLADLWPSTSKELDSILEDEFGASNTIISDTRKNRYSDEIDTIFKKLYKEVEAEIYVVTSDKKQILMSVDIHKKGYNLVGDIIIGSSINSCIDYLGKPEHLEDMVMTYTCKVGYPTNLYFTFDNKLKLSRYKVQFADPD